MGLTPDALTCPMLPLRGIVVFPHTPVSLIVGRAASVAAVAAANEQGGQILLVTQRQGERSSPGPGDLFEVGTVARILQTLRLPDGNTKVLVEGARRARIEEWLQSEPYAKVRIDERAPPVVVTPELEALVRTVKTTFERYVKLNRAVPPEMLLAANALEDPDRLADMLVGPLRFKLQQRQELLEVFDVAERLDRVYRALLGEIEFLQVERKVKGSDPKSGQREFWLNEQMKAIQKELGDKDGRTDLEELARALAGKELPDLVRDRAEKELRKLGQMNTMSAEATVVRNYLDWIVALPWAERSGDAPSIQDAAAILNEDHYGLRTVKERIVEYIAVSRLVDRMRGPILCLVGPPGVGKTSLARSIARSTGRPFVRISLGGVRDEAEIRGHRRTYIGAMPGKLLHAMKRAGTVDPVLLLDEIDKMTADFRGDPAAALLEVLDPEQNKSFSDHYVDLDYDLSDVTFICTANTLQGIPHALKDRLEIIELSGYTEREKASIARRYLLPKQQEANGITEANLEVTGPALLQTIRAYTKEAGVRELERQLARVCRKVARRVVRFGPETSVRVTSRNLHKLLGVPRYDYGTREESDDVGVVKGLAVSPWGGELLNIEVATVPGKGKLILTGRLGDWLKESATAAFTYIRSRAEALRLDADFHETQDFHVHYPGNALKTDGPSAGISMAVALVSALTGIPARSDTAMTGEITLRGRVLPIGGLKQKLLAAHRGGITRVLIPEGNSKDLEDVPDHVMQALEIIRVSHMDRVLKEALSGPQIQEIFGTHVADPEIAVDSPQAERPAGSRVRGD